jgi:hypothetical protein
VPIRLEKGRSIGIVERTVTQTASANVERVLVVVVVRVVLAAF